MVVYSIGSAWLSQRAGVEHAIELRHNALTSAGYSSKILLTSDIVETSNTEMLSMFEYFQGKPSHFSVSQFYEIEQCHTILNSGNVYTIVNAEGDKVRTIIENHHSFEVIHYFEGVEIIDTYTARGYHRRQVGDFVHYFDKDGRTKLIKDISSNVFQLYDGNKVLFLNFADLVTRFINLITTANDLVIFDRLDLLESVPESITSGARLFLVIHNNHIASNNVRIERQTNSFYTYLLNKVGVFEKIITATSEQACDIAKRFNLPTTCIPVAYVESSTLEKSREIINREQKTAIMFSRIAIDKQIDKIAEAFKIVTDRHPSARLEIYGFANREQDGTELAKNLLTDKIDSLNLQDNIVVSDYISDKDELIKIAQRSSVYLLGSTAEGFNIGLLEGLSGGCVGVSTDVKYGPSEQIINNVSGYVVPYNDFIALAEAISLLFDNTDKLAEMRNHSLDHLSQFYTLEKVAKLWTDLIEGGQNYEETTNT